MNVCKDCEYCEPQRTGLIFISRSLIPYLEKKRYDIAVCTHPSRKAVEINPVTGDRKFRYTRCWVIRWGIGEDKDCPDWKGHAG